MIVGGESWDEHEIWFQFMLRLKDSLIKCEFADLFECCAIRLKVKLIHSVIVQVYLTFITCK